MKVSSYKELIVWQRSIELVKEVYIITERFPQNETYGLTSQMRRAAIAIPSNIAEGYLRGHRKEFGQFLSISLGSSAELETQVIICKSVNSVKDLDYSKIDSLLIEVMKMLYVMIRKVKT